MHNKSKDRKGEMEKVNRKEEWACLRIRGFVLVFVFGFFTCFAFIYVFLDTKQNLTIYKL